MVTKLNALERFNKEIILKLLSLDVGGVTVKLEEE